MKGPADLSWDDLRVAVAAARLGSLSAVARKLDLSVATVGRRLDRPMLNLGFSGNAQMEPEVATLLAEQDPCLFVIDPLPNMDGPMVTERAEAFMRILLAARPTFFLAVPRVWEKFKNALEARLAAATGVKGAIAGRSGV